MYLCCISASIFQLYDCHLHVRTVKGCFSHKESFEDLGHSSDSKTVESTTGNQLEPLEPLKP